MKIWRQGDVLIREVESIPETAKIVGRDGGRIVLAYGEVTGHAHAILDRDTDLYSVADEVDRWLRVGQAGASLVHEEHGTVTLTPGPKRVSIQQQYTPKGIVRQID